jgi:uncharacterized membrane protein YdbT with pleckstrin-like domain
VGYVEQSLSSGERVILKARLHWGMFISPIWGIMVAMFFIVVGAILLGFPHLLEDILPSSISPDDYEIMFYSIVIGVEVGGLLSLFIAFLRLLNRISTFISTEFAVTNKRVIGKSGMLRRRSLEIMLSKIESVSVDEPFWGRILNFGTIVVKGSGGTSQPFHFISDAMALRLQINNLLPPAGK